jgi:hypothetical protein
MEGGSPSYFSNQMPRTFAFKPDYSVRFSQVRNIKAPSVSVLEVLRKKLSRIGDLDSPSGARLTNVKCKDARTPASYRNVGKVGLTITSPPYYGMRTYVEDQWLRNWFIGGPPEIDYGNDQQIRHTGHTHSSPISQRCGRTSTRCPRTERISMSATALFPRSKATREKFSSFAEGG